MGSGYSSGSGYRECVQVVVMAQVMVQVRVQVVVMVRGYGSGSKIGYRFWVLIRVMIPLA